MCLYDDDGFFGFFDRYYVLQHCKAFSTLPASLFFAYAFQSESRDGNFMYGGGQVPMEGRGIAL